MPDTIRWEIRSPEADAELIDRAGRVIRDGGLVAFPTETVYGLGANALDTRAAARIYEAKQRAANDPCIVHLASVADLDRVARLSRRVAPLARRLAEHFWPGPLSIVVPRADAIPPVVTAGRRTVAVRVPNHPIALALIRAAGVPIAAPSANRFGHTSPTMAQHVWDDLAGRIDVILDGGPTPLGVESTVLDLTTRIPALLRPGGVPLERLRAVLGQVQEAGTTARASARRGLKSPGLSVRHYAPRGDLYLLEGPPLAVRREIDRRGAELQRAGRTVGALVADEDLPGLASSGLQLESVGSEADLAGVARRLFAALRSLEDHGCDVILARSFDRQGLGAAIHNRLVRAAGGRIITCR